MYNKHFMLLKILMRYIYIFQSLYKRHESPLKANLYYSMYEEYHNDIIGWYSIYEYTSQMDDKDIIYIS